MIQQTIDDLDFCNLPGMKKAYLDQDNNPSIQELGFHERFGIIVGRERTEKETRKIKRLQAQAKLKVPSACIEDIKYLAARGLDRSVMADLSTIQFIRKKRHVIFTGATGTGKTWLACALGNQAIRMGYKVLYKRLSRLLEELQIAGADGTLCKLREKIRKADLLILDDWGLSPMTAQGRQELLEIVDDRIGESSIVITSQLPVNKWHDYFGEPTIADAILDRLVHGSYRVELEGDTMRKMITVDSDASAKG